MSTRIRTAFGIGATALCLGAATVTLQARAAAVEITDATAAHPLAGEWAGRATSGGASAAVSFRFEPKPDGTLVARFSLPQTNIVDATVGKVKREDEEFLFYDFRMRLSADGSKLEGHLPFYARRLEIEAVKGALPAASARPPAAAIAEPRWTFDAKSPLWSSPAVHGGRVYFGSHDGKLRALEATTGKPLWQFASAGAIVARPSIQSDALYVPSDDGFLYKLDLSGQQLWRFDMRGASVPRQLPGIKQYTYDYLASAATLADGLLYVGSADGHLYAIDPEQGTERWKFKTGGLIRSTPAVAHGRVYIGSHDGLIYALDAASGALRWKRATGDVVNSSAVVSGENVVIGSRSTDIYALDAQTGAARWKYFYWMSWVESSATLRDGVAYIGSSDYQRLYALNASDGRELWWYDTDGSAWSTPAVTRDAVYIGVVGTVGYSMDHRGGFRSVDRRNGRERWRLPMKEIEGSFAYGVASSPAVAGGMVYFGGLDGVFYAMAQ